MKRLVLALLLLSIHCSSVAQTDPSLSPARRDATAIGFVQASIAALGGERNITQQQSGVVSATIAAQRSGWPSGTQTWKFSGNRTRQEFATTEETFISVTDSTGGARTFRGKVEPIRAHVTKAQFIPVLAARELLRRYQDTAYSFTLVGSRTEGSRTVIQVQTRLERDDLQDASVQIWSLDATTALPVRIEYRQVDNFNVLDTSVCSVELTDFRVVSGVLVPFVMSSSLEGMPLNRITVQSVAFNVNLSPTEFARPAGGAQ